MATLSCRRALEFGPLQLALVHCDGRDCGHAQEEFAARESLVVPLAGRFERRSRSGRLLHDGGRAARFEQGQGFVIRHPERGGDLCLSLAAAPGSAFADRIAASLRPDALWLSDEARAAARAIESALRCGPTTAPALALEESCARLLLALAPRTALRTDGRARATLEALQFAAGERLAETRSLSEIAARAGCSLFHAAHSFRAGTGRSLHAYRTGLRLDLARRLLLETRDSLDAIAQQCGFAHAPHFVTAFRRSNGVTPGAWRRAAHRQRTR